MALIKIADDEKNMRWSLSKALEKEKYEVQAYENGKDLYESLAEKRPDLIIVDQKMPVQDGLTTLQLIKDNYPSIPVIMITAFGSIESAIEVIKAGAFDYITKPFDLEHLKIVIKKALEFSSLNQEVSELRTQLGNRYSFHNIIGKSHKMQEIFQTIEQIADTSATVLITGESGTGKELIARAIHYHSNRKNKPFVAVNCAALPETLLESELFGHEKGAFTGSVGRKIGRFEMANGGTIFLDEIGEISPTVQVKLLRVLQEREFERVGGIDKIQVDIRVIAATNKDLLKEIEKGNFREDLYYRLNVLPLHLPPLRERTEDIPLLVNFFLEKHSQGGKIKQVSERTLQLLMDYSWPGNIRELENVMERMIIICREDVITPQYLPENIKHQEQHKPETKQGFRVILPDEGISLEEVEKSLIEQALEKAKGNQSRAAKHLGISRHTLIYRMKKFGLA